MGNLKREIKALQLDIDSQQEALRLNAALLLQKMQKPQVICLAMLAGFGTGYLLGLKLDKQYVKKKVAQAPSLLNKAFDHIKIFLPLIINKL